MEDINEKDEISEHEEAEMVDLPTAPPIEHVDDAKSVQSDQPVASNNQEPQMVNCCCCMVQMNCKAPSCPDCDSCMPDCKSCTEKCSCSGFSGFCSSFSNLFSSCSCNCMEWLEKPDKCGKCDCCKCPDFYTMYDSCALALTKCCEGTAEKSLCSCDCFKKCSCSTEGIKNCCFDCTLDTKTACHDCSGNSKKCCTSCGVCCGGCCSVIYEKLACKASKSEWDQFICTKCCCSHCPDCCPNCCPECMRQYWPCCFDRCNGCWEKFVKGCCSATPEEVQLLREAMEKGWPMEENPKLDKESINARLCELGGLDCLFNLVLHETSYRLDDPLVVHPLVKTCVVDLRTGEYLAKGTSDPVVATYENTSKDGQVVTMEYIMPFMSQAFSLQKHNTNGFVWNEDFVLNKPLADFFKPHVIIFFEILEFGKKIDLSKYPNNLYPIAWGFLRPLGVSGQPNTGKMKLQLYSYSPKCPNPDRPRVPSIYYEYVFQRVVGRNKYPSALEITLNARPPISEEEKKTRGKAALPGQVEIGRKDFEELKSEVMAKKLLNPDVSSEAIASDSANDEERRQFMRQRRANDPCLLPNALLYRVAAAREGVSAIEFSPDGNIVAAACGEGQMHPIKLFQSNSGHPVFTFLGHHGLIYDLCWSPESNELLSASGDYTVKLWNTVKFASLPILTLQHSSYVYSAKFLCRNDSKYILTGAFDGHIRMFDANNGNLLCEFNDHTLQTERLGSHSNILGETPVNSIAVAPDGKRFFSVDGSGVIKFWMFQENDTSIPYKSSSIYCEELMGDSLGCIQYHPKHEILIVYCKDNSLYQFSLRTMHLVKKYVGASCSAQTLHHRISPCGKYLVAGSEDGRAYFWQIPSGKLVHVVNLELGGPVTDVSWHPTQHILAFASFGAAYPIVVLDNVRSEGAFGCQPIAIEPLHPSQSYTQDLLSSTLATTTLGQSTTLMDSMNFQSKLKAKTASQSEAANLRKTQLLELRKSMNLPARSEILPELTSSKPKPLDIDKLTPAKELDSPVPISKQFPTKHVQQRLDTDPLQKTQALPPLAPKKRGGGSRFASRVKAHLNSAPSNVATVSGSDAPTSSSSLLISPSLTSQ